MKKKKKKRAGCPLQEIGSFFLWVLLLCFELVFVLEFMVFETS